MEATVFMIFEDGPAVLRDSCFHGNLTYPELADIERCCDFEYPPLEELETIQEL
jgi:hypothetical protein